MAKSYNNTFDYLIIFGIYIIFYYISSNEYTARQQCITKLLV